MGGHANVYWDSLVAELPIQDEVQANRILAALGLEDRVSAGQDHLELGIRMIDDFRVYIIVNLKSPMKGVPPSVQVSFFLDELPAGASINELRRAQRLEELLVQGGVPPPL